MEFIRCWVASHRAFMAINKSKVSLCEFPLLVDNKGSLSVYQSGAGVPFAIQRVFTVRAGRGEVRGHHAHKQCAQLIVCVSGSIRVKCNDGQGVQEYLLENMGKGVLVPPGIWAEEEYLEDNSLLMVLCDRAYEPDDYIRDYGDF